MSFQVAFETGQGISSVQGEGVPEGRGGNGKGSVTHGAVFGCGDGGKEVCISRTQMASGRVTMEEVREV